MVLNKTCFIRFHVFVAVMFSLQISKLLVVDPRKRLTAAEALQHPFFKQEVNISITAFTRFKRIGTVNKTDL